MRQSLVILIWLAMFALLAGCGSTDNSNDDDAVADDDAVDDDAVDDDALDDDLDDDSAGDDDIDDDAVDDDSVDDDAVDDDTTPDDDSTDDDAVDDDSIDDDSIDDDSADDDSVDDDSVDDDTAVEEDFIAVGQAALSVGVANLLSWHGQLGRTVWYEETETIAATYPGEDLPAQIRAYLQSVLDPAKRQFVLLVGSNDTLPMREVDPDPLSPGEYSCATDVYYADLNGDFDADGDGIYGEYGEDTYDWAPEMYVGRLPFDNVDTLSSITDKTIEFEANDPDYKWETLLGAGSIAFDGDSSIIVQMIYDMIVAPNGYHGYRLYEQPGFIPPDDWLTHETFVTRLKDYPAGLVMSASHGSDHCAYAGEPFVCNTDTPQFSEDEPSVVFSSACSNGNVTVENSLAAAFMGHGAVAYLGSTSTTHPGDIGEASLIFLVMMNHTLVKNTPLAVGMDISKQMYMDTYFPLQWYDDGLYLRNFFGFNLMGDPALAYWRVSPFR